MDPIWFIWDIILLASAERNPLVGSVIQSLLSLFTLRYIPSAAKKRKYLVYFAISMVTDVVDLEQGIIKETNKSQLEVVSSKIETIYKQIKENEQSPNVDYLFLNGAKSNLDKTIAKLEQMNKLGGTFIPRL